LIDRISSRVEQTDPTQTVLDSKNPRIVAQTKRISACNFFGFEHGILLPHIKVTPKASSYCMVVLPLGKYEYLCLPMDLWYSPDIFQEKMSKLMQGLEFA
jgi:hypothetical protein